MDGLTPRFSNSVLARANCEVVRRFRNRVHAGKILAQAVSTFFAENKDKLAKEAVVLAIPRGSIEIGIEVSTCMNCPLDVIGSKKISAPEHDEFAIGAITRSGFGELDAEIIHGLQIPPEYVKEKAAEQKLLATELEAEIRGNHPPVQLKNKTVIIVDDGIATGMTVKAAALDVQSQQPHSIVIATPVIAQASIAQMKRLQGVVGVVYALAPIEFRAVGLWYESFPQVLTAEAKAQFESHKHKTAKAIPVAAAPAAAAAATTAAAAATTAAAAATVAAPTAAGNADGGTSSGAREPVPK